MGKLFGNENLYFIVYPRDEGGLNMLTSATRDGAIKLVLKSHPNATLIQGKILQGFEVVETDTFNEKSE